MNLIHVLSNILIHFLYGDDVVLQTYQSQLIELAAMGIIFILVFLFFRFILRCFSGIFLRY